MSGEVLGPFTETQRNALIRNGEQVYACWWCLNETNRRGDRADWGNKDAPYWAANACSFIGHRIACPNHSSPNKRTLP